MNNTKLLQKIVLFT